MTCTTLWALLGLMLAGCPCWFSATAEVTKPGKGVYLSGDVIIGKSIFCTTLILYFLSEIENMYENFELPLDSNHFFLYLQCSMQLIHFQPKTSTFFRHNVI